MKMKYWIYLIYTFEIIYCIELTGFKFEVNEEMANAALYHFYPDINNAIKDMDIDDIHASKGINIRDRINIKISDLKAHIFVREYISKYLISFTKHATADINSFSLDANINITSKTVNGSLYPDAKFIGTPKHDIDLYVNIGGFAFGLNIALESLVKKEIKKAINDFIENQSILK